MTTQTEALKRALELAHEGVEIHSPNSPEYKVCAALIALAQPEQEPVAYLCENAVGHKYFRWKKPSSTYKPIALYASPPERDLHGIKEEA